MFFLGHCLKSRSAKKQSVIAQSNTKVEYKALSIAISKVYWLIMLLQDLQIHLFAPTLYSDNISVISLASNSIYHAHSKHIEIDCHFIREKFFNKDTII